MKAIFIAAILICSVFAVQDEAMATIQKLEKSKTGKRLLDTIQLQMESGDPADDLIHMLQDQEDQLQAEQDIADDFILALQNQCVEDLAILVDEISSTRIKIQQLDDLIAELVPIKEKKQAEKEDLIDFKNLIEEKLAEMEIAHDQKEAEWQEEAYQHDSQTAIIQKAKDIIVSGFNVNFLQTKTSVVPQIMAQLSQHFNQAKKTHYKLKGMTSIFRVLAQVSSAQEGQQASQSGLQKIVELCDQLLDKIAESRAIEKTDYDHWMAEYKQTHDKLTAVHAETVAKIDQLTLEINTLIKRINIASVELADQTVRLEQKIQQHDERENFCDNAGATYASEREARGDQREIISDAIGLLTAKIRLLKKYVSDRVQTLEKPI